jgi:hypothetical protein
MACFSEETANGIGEASPHRALISQRATAAPRQRVHASLPSRIGRRPPAAEQAGLLEAMERRVNCAFRQFEFAAATATNFLNNGIAVRWAARQRREHDHVKMTL